MDRLTKDFSVAVKLLDAYNPKFLCVSTVMRYDQFVSTIQVATAEEEFRFKYGKVYRTSEAGYQRFANIHKDGIEMFLKTGKSLAEVAEMHENIGMPLPYDWNWNEETLNKILEIGESK